MVIEKFSSLSAKTNQFSKTSTILTDEGLMIFLKQNFQIPTHAINARTISNYCEKLKQQSIFRFLMLDRIFFQPLCEQLGLRRLDMRRILKSTQIQKLIGIIHQKIRLFQQLIIDQLTKAIQQKIEREKQKIGSQNYEQINRKKMVRFQQIKQYFLYNSLKLINLYFQSNNKKAQPLPSRIFIISNRVAEDDQLAGYIQHQIRKLNADYQRDNNNKQRQQIFYLHPQFSYNDFIQKILYHYRVIDEYIFKCLCIMIDARPQSSSMRKKISPGAAMTLDLSSSRLFPSLTTPWQQQPPQKQQSSREKNTTKASPITLKSKKQAAYNIIIKNLEIQNIPSAKCINCVQFLYQNFPVKIQRNNLVEYHIIPSIHSIKQSPDSIREVITALLNKGRGTILFDCRQEQWGFVPVGERIGLKQQQSYKSSFQNLLKCIEPQSYLKLVKIEMDFIPLKECPLQHQGRKVTKNYNIYIERQFQPELYVMRVKLCSKGVNEFYGCNIDKMTYFFTRHLNSIITLKGEQVYQQMKRRTFQFMQLKSMKQVNLLERALDEQLFNTIIRGRRHHLKNVHQGKCLETIFLKVKTQERN